MRAQVLQLRKIPRGTRVGYGGTFEARRDSVLATIGAGYADGIPRALSNKGKVYASGNYCPIVGRVSMDTLHIDVTGLSIEEGDWVELIGSNIRLDELALLSGTIAYEILIGLGKRCVTVYSD
jgi:alanine racemase